MKLKKDILGELSKVGYLFAILVIILKIVFYKEDLMIIIRMSAAFIYIYFIPGYFIMLYWKEKIEFIERLIVGFGVSAAILGLTSYLSGPAAIDIFIWSYIYPIVIVILFSIINSKKIIEK
ncbi:MAG: hypothetical protein KAK00_04910 [Nanoarchaeota archaeon]|nr:hypothetical protein [Nanoarchaeota archaeon]